MVSDAVYVTVATPDAFVVAIPVVGLMVPQVVGLTVKDTWSPVTSVLFSRTRAVMVDVPPSFTVEGVAVTVTPVGTTTGVKYPNKIGRAHV